VRQFFLRDPGEEGEFLATLDAFLRRFSVLVTFNGKSFDWPLLENRFIGHRQFRRPPLVDPPHIDLLHPARRLWRRRLQSCALSSLESAILQVERTEEDVPGWMIPSLYFAYLRSGDATALRRVFYHNLYDILSLAILAIHLDHVLADPMAGAVRDAPDFVCLARQYDLAGDTDRAIACLEAALQHEPGPEDRREALTRLAAIHKRERRWDVALALWDRLLEEGTEAALFALVERAKYYEHVERDYLEALDEVQRALQLAELAGPSVQVDIGDLEHRRGRLLNRVYRERSWTRGR
jgi:tetratricopeptide (TPR) repeat protein